MPTYRVTLDNGQTYNVTTDTEVTSPDVLHALMAEQLGLGPAAPVTQQAPFAHEATTGAAYGPSAAQAPPANIAYGREASTPFAPPPPPVGTPGTPVPSAMQQKLTQLIPEGGILQGLTQGAVQAVDEGVMGLPNLIASAATPAVNAVLAPFGREVAEEEPGTPGYTRQRFMQRPLETLLAGPQGFARLEGEARLVQDLARQTGGVMVTSRLAHMISAANEAIPLSDALIQAVGASTGQRIGEQFGPWGGIIGELVGAMGAKQTEMLLGKVYRSISPRHQAEVALGKVYDAIEPGIATEHAAAAERLNQLVPGLKLTPFQRLDTPETLAIQETLERQHPELAQQLRMWRVRNQQLLQTAFGERMGPPGSADPASLIAVEGLRNPFRQATTRYDAAIARHEDLLMQAEQALAQAKDSMTATHGMQGAAVEAAKTRLTAAEARVQDLRATQKDLTLQRRDEQLRLAQERAPLIAAAQQAAEGNLPGGKTLTFTERMEETTKVWRQIFEERFQLFRERAKSESAKIDPQNKIRYPAADLETQLDAHIQRLDREGLTVPSALTDIQTVINTVKATTPEGSVALLTMDDLRNARSRLLEDSRKMPFGIREKTMMYDMDAQLKNAMRAAASESNVPGALQRYEDFARFYAQGIQHFVDGPGEVLLKVKRLPPGGRTGELLPEEFYQLPHGVVLNHIWGKAPIPGASEVGARKFFEQFKQFGAEMEQSPAGIEALKDFATQDFYLKTVNKDTRVFDPKAGAAWFRDHDAQLEAIPGLKTAFATPQEQLSRIAEAEQQSEKFLAQLQQQHQQAARATLTAEGQRRIARERAQGAQQTMKTEVDIAKADVQQAQDLVQQAKLTAKEAGQQAKVAVDAAYDDWKAVFGASHQSQYALQQQAATDALGAMPRDLIAGIETDGRKNLFALTRLTDPIKNNNEALMGLRSALWESYVEKHIDPKQLSEVNLLKEFPLRDPTMVMRWLNDYRPWFMRYSPEHYDDLMTIARGMKMNSMVGAAAESAVPSALKEMTPFTRGMVRLGAGSIVGGIASVIKGIPWGIGGFISGSTGVGHLVQHFSDNQRFELLKAAVSDPDVSRLVRLASEGKAHPNWLRTSFYHTFMRLGLFGSGAADIATGNVP